MFFRNFINRKLNTRFNERVRRKAPYLRKYKFANTYTKNLKYDIGEDVYFDKAPMPDSYLVNEVVLIPKNNKTLFLYYEVRNEDYIKLKNEYNVYDTTTILIYKEEKLFRKIQGLSHIGSYYIADIESNGTYLAKIGFENPDGDFFELANSKEAITPSGKISSNRAYLWGIPFYENGVIKMKFYSKDNLPKDSNQIKEIKDIRELSEYLNKKYYKLDENGNIIFIGASDRLITSNMSGCNNLL